MQVGVVCWKDNLQYIESTVLCCPGCCSPCPHVCWCSRCSPATSSGDQNARVPAGGTVAAEEKPQLHAKSERRTSQEATAPAHAQQSSECNNDAKLHCLLKQGRPSFRLHNLHSSKMCVHNPENSGSCSASFASLRTRDLYGHLSIREVASKDGSPVPQPRWLAFGSSASVSVVISLCRNDDFTIAVGDKGSCEKFKIQPAPGDTKIYPSHPITSQGNI